MKRKTFTSDDGEQKMKLTKLIGFLARTIKTPAIPMPPTMILVSFQFDLRTLKQRQPR